MNLLLIQICLFLLLCFSKSQAVNDEVNEEKSPTDQFEKIYKKIFKQKHAELLSVVKSIVAMDNYAKQYKMINIALEKMFQVLIKSKVIIESAGYFPGDEIPSNDTVKEALSLIVENTVLFGEILLRMPDITHLLLQSNKEGLLMIQWSLGFCHQSNLIDGPAHKLLRLTTQELGLVERDPNYVNPYRANQQTAKQESQSENLQTPAKPKKKTSKAKGPRLSGSRHTEL